MAIAHDSSTVPTTAVGSSQTLSHTCSGSNRILFVNVCYHTAKTFSSCTYAGTAMTEIASQALANFETMKLFYLINPASGANNVVVTLTSSDNITTGANSYTGAKQTGQPDAFSKNGTLETTTSYAKSLTTVADNCWVLMFGLATSGPTISAGAGTVVRGQEKVQYGNFIADSGAAVTPAGSKTLTVTSTSQPFVSILASFSPLVSSTYITGVQTITGIQSITF